MADVIKDMLNEKSLDMKFKKVFIGDIEPSPDNKYPMQEIEELAENIGETGLMHPITLYQLPEGRYMILSGERRFRAMKYRYDHGDERWEEVPAVVKAVDLNDRLIKRYIRRGNANRSSITKELKAEIIRESLEDYLIEKRDGKVPVGMLKIEWIAMDTGYSARSIQDYLNPKDNKQEANSEKKEKLQRYVEMQKDFTNRLKMPVKITDKQISIKIKNEEDLEKVLELLERRERN